MGYVEYSEIVKRLARIERNYRLVCLRLKRIRKRYEGGVIPEKTNLILESLSDKITQMKNEVRECKNDLEKIVL